jgi:hypothetical protein
MIERSNKECPCKLLPRSFSSYTAAEYGDVHSLSKIQDVATRRDDSGYTPLHYAAQFNQVAATAMLLELGCSIDGGGYCGATPLHRASFSGATASMKVLLVWNDDIPCHYPEEEEEVNNDTGIFTARTSSQLSDRKTCNLLARDSRCVPCLSTQPRLSRNQSCSHSFFSCFQVTAMNLLHFTKQQQVEDI